MSAGLPATHGLAQDVTVSDPAWYLTEGAPDELPKTKSRLRPDYPDEMSRTGEVGYVTIHRYSDEHGTPQATNVTGTHLPFQRSVEHEIRDWTLSAAVRGGRPEGAWIAVTVIFNP